jgi:hypothetical protein
MDGGQLGHCLDLDQHSPFHDAVGFEARFERMAAVHERNRSVRFNLQPVRLEFEYKAAMVYRLEQPSAKERMNSDGASDDLRRQRFVAGRILEHTLAVSK